MKRLSISFLCCVAFLFSFAQTNYLELGNQQLAREDFVAAEKTFRQAMHADSSNLVYQC